MAKAWVIRTGRMGERDTWALENRCSGGGWWEVPDLTRYTTRGEVAGVVADTFSGAADGKIATSRASSGHYVAAFSPATCWSCH